MSPPASSSRSGGGRPQGRRPRLYRAGAALLRLRVLPVGPLQHLPGRGLHGDGPRLPGRPDGAPRPSRQPRLPPARRAQPGRGRAGRARLRGDARRGDGWLAAGPHRRGPRLGSGRAHGAGGGENGRGPLRGGRRPPAAAPGQGPPARGRRRRQRAGGRRRRAHPPDRRALRRGRGLRDRRGGTSGPSRSTCPSRTRRGCGSTPGASGEPAAAGRGVRRRRVEQLPPEHPRGRDHAAGAAGLGEAGDVRRSSWPSCSRGRRRPCPAA
ncbi:hypothetical protein AIF0345_2058 [Actinomyces israelii]|nr:hypothetical protein AIF0345_2058 [Actinomyces israelii]